MAKMAALSLAPMLLALALTGSGSAIPTPSSGPEPEPSSEIDRALPPSVVNGDWELVSEVDLSDGLVPVAKYRSRRTGLTVVTAQAETPIIDGWFCVATEAFDHNGLPHTLEHLIFLGSEEHPYKNTLDLSASRLLVGKRNAGTYRDKTCYKMAAAGSDAFNKVLDIYLDHMFFPLLKDEDFVTQVHHINAKGEDAGVVYSEMQGVENSRTRIQYRAYLNALYPGGSSYDSITGGRLKELRENTTIEQIRDYHRQFYQLKNTYINVIGPVDLEQLFQTIKPLEEKYLARQQHKFLSPFLTEYPPMIKGDNRTVYFPSKEENLGSVALAWRLDHAQVLDNIREMHAVDVLGDYLTNYATSPMQKAFVYRDQPLASGVSLSMLYYSQPAVVFGFSNVPVDRMEDVDATFHKVIDDILEAGEDAFEMEQVHTIINNSQSNKARSLENNPFFLMNYFALDQVYGRDPGDLADILSDGQSSLTKQLLAYPASYWLNLMRSIFKSHQVKVLTYPSQSLDEQLKQEENERLTAQKERLGEDGRKEAARILQASVDSVVQPPAEVLGSLPIGSASSIQYRSLTHYNRTTAVQPKDFDLRSIPFSFYMDHIQSRFVQAYLFFGLGPIAPEDRPYLPLLKSTWIKSDLIIDGQRQTLEEVNRRNSETLLSMTIGLSYTEMLSFNAKMLMDQYEPGLDLIRDTIHHVDFNAEQTLSMAKQLLSKIPAKKQSGSSLADTLAWMTYYDDAAMTAHTNLYVQEPFLEDVIRKLETEPDTVLAKMRELHAKLVQPDNTVVYIAADVPKLTETHGERAAEFWTEFYDEDKFDFPEEETLDKRVQVRQANSFRDEQPAERHVFTTVPGTSSCFVRQLIPYNNTDLESPELATLRVLTAYMSKILHDRVRGQGLTYGISMAVSASSGHISVRFYRSSHLAEAYAMYRDILRNYSRPDYEEWDSTLMESYRGSQVFARASLEQSLDGLVGRSVSTLMHPANDPNFNRGFVRRIEAVTLDRVKEAASKYLPMLLEVKYLETGVACGEEQADKVVSVFEEEYGLRLGRFGEKELEEVPQELGEVAQE